MKTKAVCITCLLAAVLCSTPAHAAVILSLEQVGLNVVATATGTIDLTGLTPYFSGSVQAFVQADEAILHLGNNVEYDAYMGILGPTSFGSGGDINATSASGVPFAIIGSGGSPYIDVPHGFVSGSSISSTATWNNTTLAGLGITSQIYNYTWGPGTDDSISFYAGVPVPSSSTPEPAPALLLILAAAAFALFRRTSSASFRHSRITD